MLQSLVARIESGGVDPSFDRVLQLVRACGLDLEVHLVPLDEDAWTLVEQGAALTPDQRLDRMLDGVDLLQAAAELAGRRVRWLSSGRTRSWRCSTVTTCATCSSEGSRRCCTEQRT